MELLCGTITGRYVANLILVMLQRFTILVGLVTTEQLRSILKDGDLIKMEKMASAIADNRVRDLWRVGIM